MKKSLLVKRVGLIASLLTLIMFFVAKVPTKIVYKDISKAGKGEISLWSLIENPEMLNGKGTYDEVKFRMFVLIAFILVSIAAVYFLVSIVLEVTKVKLPVSNLNLGAACLLVLGLVVYVIAQFVTYKEKTLTGTTTVNLQVLSSTFTYIALFAGLSTVVSAVLLKDKK